jgi:hypothetical protein
LKALSRESCEGQEKNLCFEHQVEKGGMQTMFMDGEEMGFDISPARESQCNEPGSLDSISAWLITGLDFGPMVLDP